MSLLIQTNPNKPNRLTVENKDSNKVYHLDYSKWAVSQAFNSAHNEWLKKIKINKDFYKNEQWEDSEDIEAFLKDKTGQERNRIKMTNNLIRPMVEQYRGNAIILKINAQAQNISPLSINRRDKRLAEQLFKTETANEFPKIGEAMRKDDKSIGQDENETKIIFENLYVDEYVEKINSLLKFTKNLNEFPVKQQKAALNLALTGLTVSEAFEHGGHLRFRMIESEDFFWDRDSREFDLSDAAYMGYMNPLDVSYILEKYQPSTEDALLLENFVSASQNQNSYLDTTASRTFSSNRLPVYSVFWKDTDKFEYAYVMDEFGYPYLTRINWTYDGEEGPRYTDADIIDPPIDNKNKKLFKNGKKRKLYVDMVRFCRFVPSEVLSTQKKTTGEPYGDIVLEFGTLDYQEVDLLDYSNCKFPIKAQTWGYVDGEVFSPVDDAINPQRFVNRVLSVTEQLINSAGGSNVIIDEDSIDPNSKDQIYYDIKEGNPITVRTKGKGVPNTVGYYDNTPKQGAYAMFGIIPTIKQMVQDTTGINEGLRGESTGSDQLVGVTELLIQRGSLMQEPFYEAIARLFVQMYQYTASVGKLIYIDNEREIVNMLGDSGAEVIKLSEDMKNEDFNVFVERENDDSVLKSQANQMLAVFLERGMIDDKIFANLFNRSTPNDVTRALRNQAKLKAEAERQASIEQAKQMEQMQMQEQQMLAQQNEQNANDKMVQAQLEMRRQDTDLDKALLKSVTDAQKNEQSAL
ncbi:MAG: hypothetical protein ACK5B9_04495 [Flavobacteriia bacterium]|jgi:hypothetical protein